MAHTIDCEECNEGLVECFEDRMDSRGEHYTRDWTEPCEHCGGTGRVEMDAVEAHVEAALDADVDAALGLGAATELPQVIEPVEAAFALFQATPAGADRTELRRVLGLLSNDQFAELVARQRAHGEQGWA